MGDPRIIINKLYRTLLLSVLVVALLGPSVPSASAMTPPSITVMTQNLYQDRLHPGSRFVGEWADDT